MPQSGVTKQSGYRIARAWHGHNGGRPLYLTRHHEATGVVYRVEDFYTDQVSCGTQAAAKTQAMDRLRDEGHVCSTNCQDWRPLCPDCGTCLMFLRTDDRTHIYRCYQHGVL